MGVPQKSDVAVVGSGPAGTSAAVGLARLGWRVRLYSGETRSNLEGGSARLVGALQSQGLRAAFASVTRAVPRTCHWAGGSWLAGEEHLIDRSLFDRQLRADAAMDGIVNVHARVRAIHRERDAWFIRTDKGESQVRAVVDARGRGVRASACRGPRLLAMTQRYIGVSPAPSTSLWMGTRSWYWAAADECGNLQLLAVSSPADANGGQQPAQRLFALNAPPPTLASILASATSKGPSRACAATAAWRAPAEEVGYVLAGDAALTVDPLFGNGMYEALAASPAVIAAVNTWLQTGEWQEVKRFLTERNVESWRRKLEAASSFYEQAAAAEPHPFWFRTASAYRELARSSLTASAQQVRIEHRPVLAGTRIARRRVLVGPRFPRGVWRYRDIELADLIDSRARLESTGETAARLGVDVTQVRDAVQWLKDQRAFGRGVESPAEY